MPDLGLVPTGRYNRATLWWRHEALHRGTLTDYVARLAMYKADRDQMESRFIAGAAEHQSKSIAEQAAFSAQCFAEADQAADDWNARIREAPLQTKLSRGYRKAWEKINKQAGYYTEYRSKLASGPSG